MAGSKIRLYGSTSGYVELEAPAVGDDGVLSLPTAADGFGAAGIGSNVVQTVKTDTFSASLASGAISGAAISATITPTSASSKVLVIASLTIASTTGVAGASLFVGSAEESGYIGDAAGSRKRRSVGVQYGGSASANPTASAVYLDSPATTSATVYDFRLYHGSSTTQTVYLNRSQTDTDGNTGVRTVSSITLIEVAV